MLLMLVGLSSSTTALTTEPTTATRVATEVTRLLKPSASSSSTISWAMGLTRLLRGARYRTRNVLGRIIDVEILVNMSGNGGDFGPKLLFNLVQIEAVIPVDQVDGETKVTKATRSTDSVKIGLGILGEIEVDDDVDSLNINTTGEEIRAHKIAAVSGPEVVEDTIAGLLKHAGVGVEARVAEFGDLFR